MDTCQCTPSVAFGILPFGLCHAGCMGWTLPVSRFAVWLNVLWDCQRSCGMKWVLTALLWPLFAQLDLMGNSRMRMDSGGWYNVTDQVPVVWQ